MYEHYLATTRNGVTNIEIDVTETTPSDTSTPVDAGLTITVTFAVTTDSTAWITIDNEGTVKPAFGGTGTTHDELDNYAEQAVSIWRAITGKTHTTCKYSAQWRDDPEHPDLSIDA